MFKFHLLLCIYPNFSVGTNKNPITHLNLLHGIARESTAGTLKSKYEYDESHSKIRRGHMKVCMSFAKTMKSWSVGFFNRNTKK